MSGQRVVEVCVGRGPDLAQAMADGVARGGQAVLGVRRGWSVAGPWVEVRMASAGAAGEGEAVSAGREVSLAGPPVTGAILGRWPVGVPLVIAGASAEALALAVVAWAGRGGWRVRHAGAEGAVGARAAEVGGRWVLVARGGALDPAVRLRRLVVGVAVDAEPARVAEAVAGWRPAAPDAWAWIGCDRPGARAGARAAWGAGATPVAWIAGAGVPRIWRADRGWLAGWLGDGF